MSIYFKIYSKYMPLLCLMLILTQCQQDVKIKNIKRSFYYWKTVFSLDQPEKSLLDSLQVSTLYVRYFDVDWDQKSNLPYPKAPISFKEIPDRKVIPVIFITNQTMLHIQQKEIPSLAEKIISRVKSMHTDQPDFEEIQIDCDWSDKSKNNYFKLLEALKDVLGKNTILSATIRLHQVKFSTRTGVPPADKGVLMAYNMADINDVNTLNSILEEDIIDQYTDNLHEYPLHLDLALPVYHQNVLFRAGRYIGVWRDKNIFDPTISPIYFTPVGKNKFKCVQDTFMHNMSIKKEDIVRVEKSETKEIKNVCHSIQHQLKRDTFTLILFDINSSHLKNTPVEDIKSIFHLP